MFVSEGSKLRKGDTLSRFEWQASANEQFVLFFDPNGYFYLSWNDQNRVLWKPGNGSLFGERLVMELDGNLVFYGNNNTSLWQTNTTGHGDYMSVENDGTLAVYNSTGNKVWSSAFNKS